MKKKTKPRVCLELKSGRKICFIGTVEALGLFIDLIGSGELKISAVTNPKKLK